MQLDVIKGIGPQKKKKLEKLNLLTAEDLITHYPKRYEAPKPLKTVRDCINGEEVRLKLRVMSMKSIKKSAYDPNERLHLIAQDESELPVEVIFFHAKYIIPKVQNGTLLLLEGVFKIEGIKRIMVHPEWLKEQQFDDNSIRPVYALTDGITQNEMRRFVQNALAVFMIEESLPTLLREKARLMGKAQALSEIHKPSNKPLYTAAKYRIVYEELFELQTALLLIKSGLDQQQKKHHYPKSEGYHACLSQLPYQLTEGQLRVLSEIEEDMQSNIPMHRLLQGDVGSGKSIIAFLALYRAVENDLQCALMVPTEVLAEQHYRAMEQIFPSELMERVALLTGSTKDKKDIYCRLEQGQPMIVIGTHALIEEKVRFSRLSLIVTDEQHRFGVEQRNLLQSKGDVVDVLVMSATPIPRTLSMIRYGDMEISVLDQMPKGRQAVETKLVNKRQLGKLVGALKDHLINGHQLYFVCPLIEDNETLDLQSAEDLFIKLKSYYSDYRVALLHGKQKASEKEEVMRGFSENRIQVLVSTTVIEVGINVPNATVMCILNAERFGLAQLHQLRGRVGRGQAKGYCYLISDGKQIDNNKRLEVLETSHDGFYIAEKDLELRGPGELLGTRQHGLPELKLANFFKHQEILLRVQEDSKWMLDSEEDELRHYAARVANRILL